MEHYNRSLIGINHSLTGMARAVVLHCYCIAWRMALPVCSRHRWHCFCCTPFHNSYTYCYCSYICSDII